MEGESCWLSAPRGGLKTGRSESIVVIARVVEEIQAAMDMFEELFHMFFIPETDDTSTLKA